MFTKIKLIIAAVILLLIIGLGITIWIQSANLKKTREELSTAIANNKAYQEEYADLQDKARQFTYTIDQLNYSCDSLTQKLNNARKNLAIKDKNIKELQYLASQNSKRDSIIVQHDTLFREPDFQLDTTIKDDWSSLSLSLKYPNKIYAEYEFQNSTIVITSASKETVNPPKKCWIGRLFQRKHTVVVVDVVQENPYCVNTKQRHIKVID